MKKHTKKTFFFVWLEFIELWGNMQGCWCFSVFFRSKKSRLFYKKKRLNVVFSGLLSIWAKINLKRKRMRSNLKISARGIVWNWIKFLLFNFGENSVQIEWAYRFCVTLTKIGENSKKTKTWIFKMWMIWL